MQTVYADVLIILNTYVNFALLKLCSFITKNEANRLRLLVSALIGGVYSLIILLEEINPILLLLSKLTVSVIMVLTAYKIMSLKGFLRITATLFISSFVFAGLMFAIWLFISPAGMFFGNGTVYFGFDTLTLLIVTAVSYAVLRVIFLFSERHTPKGSIYDLEIDFLGQTVKCKGLSDSGSSLKDWFTSLPVILVSHEKLKNIPNDINMISDEMRSKLKVRCITFTTAGGESLILVFRPEKVRIKGIDQDIETDRVYIGISREKIRNGEFEAIIPYELFKENANV